MTKSNIPFEAKTQTGVGSQLSVVFGRRVCGVFLSLLEGEI